MPTSSAPDDRGGRRFLGFSEFKSFVRSAGDRPGETSLTSPVIDPGFPWDELVVSWNAAPSVSLRIEAQAIYPEHETKWYVMGLWSEDPARAPRESVVKQKDDDGNVETDTLVLKRAGGKVRIRVTMVDESGSAGEQEKEQNPLRFLGLSERHTAQSHPIMGTPWEVPLPRIRISIGDKVKRSAR